MSQCIGTIIDQAVQGIAWDHTVQVSGWLFSYTKFHGVAADVLSLINLFGTTQCNISVNFHIAEALLVL